MKKKTLYASILFLVMCTICGCGFGGFQDQSTISSGGGSSATDTHVTGVVSKGIFQQGGTVELYSVNSGGAETLLKKTVIGAFGNYSANIGSTQPFDGSSYTGVVMIKAYGSYVDEATGNVLSITKDSPLRAAITNPSGRASAMVTPLTELAVRKLAQGGTIVTATAVSDANAAVSRLFKVDIITAEPVQPNQAEFGSTYTSQAQKDYTLALAAISWLAKGSGSLDSTMATLSNSIASGTMSAPVALGFRQALNDFLASNMNQTGVSDINSTNLANVGGNSINVKISATGNLDQGVKLNGVTLTLALPPGVTVKADFTNPAQITPQAGLVFASGPSTTTAYVDAKYIPPTGALPARVRLGVSNAGGFPLGELVTVTCEVPPGVSLQPGDFTVSDLVVVVNNQNGDIYPTLGVETSITLQ